MNSILFFVLVLSIRWRKVKTATLTLTFYSGGEKIQRRKLREKFGEGEYLFSGGEENREGKGGKYLENIFSKIVKEIKKSRFRSRDFCQVLEDFVSVSENLVPEKKNIGFAFGEFGLGKKVWDPVKILYRKKVSVLVLVKILVSSISD